MPIVVSYDDPRVMASLAGSAGAYATNRQRRFDSLAAQQQDQTMRLRQQQADMDLINTLAGNKYRQNALTQQANQFDAMQDFKADTFNIERQDRLNQQAVTNDLAQQQADRLAEQNAASQDAENRRIALTAEQNRANAANITTDNQLAADRLKLDRERFGFDQEKVGRELDYKYDALDARVSVAEQAAAAKGATAQERAEAKSFDAAVRNAAGLRDDGYKAVEVYLKANGGFAPEQGDPNYDGYAQAFKQWSDARVAFKAAWDARDAWLKGGRAPATQPSGAGGQPPAAPPTQAAASGDAPRPQPEVQQRAAQLGIPIEQQTGFPLPRTPQEAMALGPGAYWIGPSGKIKQNPMR